MLETIRNRTEFDEFMKHNMDFGLEVVCTNALSISYVRLTSNGQKCAFLTKKMMMSLRNKGHLVAPRRVDDSVVFTLDYNPCSVCGSHLYRSPRNRSAFSIDTVGVNVNVGPKVVKRYGGTMCLRCAHEQDLERIDNGETIALGFTSSDAGVPLAITNDGMTINYLIEGARPGDKFARLWHVTFKDHWGRPWAGTVHHRTQKAIITPGTPSWI